MIMDRIIYKSIVDWKWFTDLQRNFPQYFTIHFPNIVNYRKKSDTVLDFTMHF